MTEVTLVEVGPRDGLQNESLPLDVPTRLQLIEHLHDAGFRHLEVGSFVSPQWVPQMAHTEEVLAGLSNRAFNSIALVPNSTGLKRALETNIRTIAVFTAASESFCQRNINCSMQESLERFQPVIQTALENGLQVRGYVSCLIACPYEGETDVSQVTRMAAALLEMGCYEVSLGDTIGAGTAREIEARLKTLLTSLPADNLALHLHDTRGQAVSAIDRSLDLDIRTFDTSIAGLGGCPYARGASGNVATEDVVYLLERNGYRTGLSMDQLARTGHWISQQLGRPYHARAGLAHYNMQSLQTGKQP
ncbi:MAG: hydroxymethylglutaryl-CoA lyase [Gammaproteobacteria bacterium]|nr:MAG: hydroxymethylglutaryl-CoA lyase [Gammaproteobacteria bacterium]